METKIVNGIKYVKIMKSSKFHFKNEPKKTKYKDSFLGYPSFAKEGTSYAYLKKEPKEYITAHFSEEKIEKIHWRGNRHKNIYDMTFDEARALHELMTSILVYPGEVDEEKTYQWVPEFELS